MIRRLFLAAIFVAPAGLIKRLFSADEFTCRVLDFEKPWNRFVRRFFGCPEDGPTDRETCKPAKAVSDSVEFEAAREKAKTLFGLRDEK